MFVGPNHPIFGPGMRGQGGRGPWGGDGFLPPMGAPPGARFDPVGPGLGPFPGGPIPGRGPSRGMPGAGNMNDPDFDDFPPPGPGVSRSGYLPVFERRLMIETHRTTTCTCRPKQYES